MFQVGETSGEVASILSHDSDAGVVLHERQRLYAIGILALRFRQPGFDCFVSLIRLAFIMDNGLFGKSTSQR